ncbi:DUF3592 domain-containing protein [Amycolatopsis minnesotensis]|uniref:DUF3592 domain-containing protein n=1 Tax=Amycolatopsis minnesotensis TaxID=337894 RepID=A0ABP5E245_9PSEU
MANIERRLRIGRRVVLGAAVVVTVLCAGLLFAAIRNDHAIESHLGRAQADVDSVAFDRTIIRYVAQDGNLHSPSTGVLYPSGLTAGDLVWVEYDTTDPDLVRVAGRTAELTWVPLGSTALVTWVVAGPLLWWLGRRRKNLGAPGEPAAEAVAEESPAA